MLVVASGLAWVSVAHVSAQTSPILSIVQKIAAKFGLKEADVQAVFDAEKTDRQAQMEKIFEDRLTQAVADGKITDAQRQAIIARHKLQLQQQTTNRTDYQAWLKANNLENVDLGFGLGFGRGPGMGHRMHGW